MGCGTVKQAKQKKGIQNYNTETNSSELFHKRRLILYKATIEREQIKIRNQARVPILDLKSNLLYRNRLEKIN